MTDPNRPADIYDLDNLRTVYNAITAPGQTLTTDQVAQLAHAAYQAGYKAGHDDLEQLIEAGREPRR